MPRITSRRIPAEGPVRPPVAALALLLLVALPLGTAACGGGGGGGEEANAATGRTSQPAGTVQTGELPPRGKAWVIFGPDTVAAEVARTPESREQGLMYRRSIPEGTGMLFVFDDSDVRSFWMKNTYVPLSIAFLSSGMQVVDIQQMAPMNEDLHTSAAAARFALEVPVGWYAEHGVQKGDQAVIVFGPRG